jgi:hypothetical protein
MAVTTAPGSTRASEAALDERSTAASTVFVLVVVALTALMLWVGPRAPRLLGLCFVIWAANVLLWKPSKWVGGFMFVGFVLASLVVLNLGRLPLHTRLSAVAVILICLAPSLAAPKRSTDHLPAVNVFCLVAAVYTGIGAFLSHESRLLTQFVSTTDRQRGLLLNGLFLAAVVAGAALASGRLLVRPGGRGERADESSTTPSEAPTDGWRAVSLIVIGMVVALAIRALGLATQLGVLVDVIYCVRLIGYLVLLRMWLEGRPIPRWMLGVLGAGLLIDVLLGLGSAALFLAARTPFAVAIMYVHIRRRIPWIPLVLAAVAVLSLNVQKDSFRAKAGGLGRLNQGNLINQGVAYTSKWVSTAQHVTKDQVSLSASRFSYGTSDLLGYISRRVPRELPYWDARTYRYIPLTALPRVIAPWKPKTLSGVQFGQHYDLLNTGSTSSSANLPLGAEAFVNFGIGGIVFVGVTFGLLLGLLGRVARRDSWPLALMGTVVASQLIGGIESDSSVVIGVAIWMGIAAYPLARWAIRRSSPGGAAR